MKNRHEQILEILSKEKNVEVKVLSDMLLVSQVTIRKDLDALAKKGLLLREHGYACINRHDQIYRNLVNQYKTKKKIAKLAEENIKDGETIMIESGPCCVLFAEELALSKKNITIITNSVFIANYIQHSPAVKFVLLGGFYQPNSRITIGPLGLNCSETYFADKYFVDIDGFSPQKNWFTEEDRLRAQTILELSKYAERVIVLTEAQKLTKQNVIRIMPVEVIKEVFTDSDLSTDMEDFLLENKVKINFVDKND
jgi:DeoR/GlpR family transcriptional regulator of sugar metabolism